MPKQEEEGMNRFVFVLCFICIVSFFSGCCTVKNTAEYTAKGIAGIVVGPFYGLAKGLSEDIDNTYWNAKKADDWFQENYW